MASPEFILSVDTGKHFAAALISHDHGNSPRLEDMYYQHKTCFMPDDVRELANELGDLLVRHQVHPDDLTLVVELPSHRYFGRSNSSALLKLMWQGLRLILLFRDKGIDVVPMPADEHNQQRGDEETRRIFDHAFDKDTTPYYQQKHGGRSNAHERDAGALGLFAAKRIRMGLPISPA